MRHIKIQIFIILLVLPLLLSSCIDEPAPPSSEKEIISEISRTWACEEEGDGIPLTFNASIAADPADGTKILVTNFHNMGYTNKVYAIVKTDLSLTIPSQTIDGQIFKGTGEITSDYTEITWKYSIEFSSGTVNITATYTYGVTS